MPDCLMLSHGTPSSEPPDLQSAFPAPTCGLLALSIHTNKLIYCATERLKTDAKTATHNLLEHGVKDNSVVVQRYLLSDNSLNSDKLGSILRRSDWYGIRLYHFERKKKS